MGTRTHLQEEEEEEEEEEARVHQARPRQQTLPFSSSRATRTEYILAEGTNPGNAAQTAKIM
jgi:hypothetical protein